MKTLLKLLTALVAKLFGKKTSYTIQIRSLNMDPNVYRGETATFQATMLGNGSPVPNFVPKFTWSADDAGVTLTPSEDTLTCMIAVPAGDPATSVTLTASATDPTGAVQVKTFAVPVRDEPMVYTIGIAQTAFTGAPLPVPAI